MLKYGGVSRESLHETSGLERLVRASFLHRLQAFGRDRDGYLFAELGNEKRFLLEIHLAATTARRVELRRSCAIRIPTADLGLLTCDIANSGHIRAILHGAVFFRNVYLLHVVVR